MLVIETLSCIAAAFLGYLFGRFGHCYINVWSGNPKWAPHHWIYGLILIIIGLFFYKEFIGLLISFFGAGYFISDLNDFLQMKFIGVDEEGEKEFWGID